MPNLRADRSPVPGAPRRARARARLLVAAAATAAAVTAALASAPPSDAAAPRAATHPQIQVGGFPTGMSLDPATDTIYVGNGTDDNVSLINGRTCNASVVSGCGQRITAVTAGTDPIGSVVDTTTNTIYAINAASGSVAVINGATCDATNTTGCNMTPATIGVGSNPEFGALNPVTHTLYVANYGSGSVSVVNLRACNATNLTGCASAVVAHVSSGPNPFAVAVDVPSDTIYVTNDGSDTVTVINGRTCNSAMKSGCSSAQHMYVGLGPAGITVDQKTNTVYVADQTSDDIAMFNGATCDSVNKSRCGKYAYRLVKGNGDRGIAVNQLTDSIYVANTHANTALVFSGRTCNGSVHTGCKITTIKVGRSPRRVVVDEPTNTIYITNANSDTVSMINGRTCNGTTTGGC